MTMIALFMYLFLAKLTQNHFLLTIFFSHVQKKVIDRIITSDIDVVIADNEKESISYTN